MARANRFLAVRRRDGSFLKTTPQPSYLGARFKCEFVVNAEDAKVYMSDGHFRNEVEGARLDTKDFRLIKVDMNIP